MKISEMFPYLCVEDAARAIKTMQVRGAPLIGATAAYGVCLALRADASDEALDRVISFLAEQRPTAVNLRWALEEMRAALRNLPRERRLAAAYARAAEVCEEDVAANRRIGEHGLNAILAAADRKKAGPPVNILTHCNAGWLATVDRGTALAPVYRAQELGVPVHVWVDETRPRNQGASLTAWELSEQGIPHTVVVDNAGGHLMQRGAVDLVITGTDRTTASGDVCNKIGTYLKALAASDCGVPFWVAVPHSSIDWSLRDGVAEIPIEERDPGEVTRIAGRGEDGRVVEAFTPDFYLPDQDLYIEVTVMKQSLVTRKNRKLREIRRLYPDVKVKLFYRRDVERLAQRYRLRIAS